MNNLINETEIILLQIHYEHPYTDKLASVLKEFDKKYHLYEKFASWEFSRIFYELDQQPLEENEKKLLENAKLLFQIYRLSHPKSKNV